MICLPENHCCLFVCFLGPFLLKCHCLAKGVVGLGCDGYKREVVWFGLVLSDATGTEKPLRFSLFSRVRLSRRCWLSVAGL